MKNMIALFSAALLFGAALTAAAQNDEAAREAYRKSQDATRVDGTESVSTLVIFNEKGEKRIRTLAGISSLYENGSVEKKLIRFTAPADVKGTGFLTIDYPDKDDDKWIYLPALRKTRRIVSSENAKSFMGSEFSYADMSLPSVEDFTYRFLPEETVNGEPCRVVEMVPKDKEAEDENGFSKKIVSLGKADCLLRKAEYFDFFGEKEKVMDVKELVEVDTQKHKFKLKHLEMTNLKNGRRSVMTIDRIKFNPSVPDSYFSTRYLEK